MASRAGGERSGAADGLRNEIVVTFASERVTTSSMPVPTEFPNTQNIYTRGLSLP
jgi:hypothetical protein